MRTAAPLATIARNKYCKPSKSVDKTVGPRDRTLTSELRGRNPMLSPLSGTDRQLR